MRKLLALIFLLAAFKVGICQRIPISQLPTYSGNPVGGWVPIVVNGITKKVDCGYFSYKSFDSLAFHYGTTIDTFQFFNRYSYTNFQVLYTKPAGGQTVSQIFGKGPFHVLGTDTGYVDTTTSLVGLATLYQVSRYALKGSNVSGFTNDAAYLTTVTSGQITTALGFTPYNSTNPSSFISGITGSMVTTALGFTPYNATNPSGYLTTITSLQITNALGFTPYNATNPSSYITGINSSNVTTALGYTPINPNGTNLQYFRGDGTLSTFPTSLASFTNGPGYLTSITLGNVTTALGYTPINPNGTTLQYTRGDGSFATFPTNLTSFTNGPGYLSSISAGSITNAMLAGSITAANLVSTDITQLGTLTTGTWHATVLGSTYGGTGTNNGSSTITLGGNLVTSGAFATTITSTATTNSTLPAGTHSLAPLDGPVFTGTPSLPTGTTAVTQAALTNNTTPATTAFVVANAGCVLITSGSTSATAAMSINFSAYYNLYRKLRIEFYNVVPATTNTNLEMRVSIDGTTYNTGATAYTYNFVTGSNAATSLGAAFIECASGISNASTSEMSGYVEMTNMNQAVTFPTLFGALQGTANAANLGYPLYFTGNLLTAQLTKGIQLLMSSGNITGNWALYGYN